MIYLYIFMLLACTHTTICERGIVISPVADLLGEPLEHHAIAHSNQIPYCGAPRPSNGCPRLHQILFNDSVEIIDQKADEYYIEIPVFYITQTSKNHCTRYWIEKKHILTARYAQKKNIDLEKFPSALTARSDSIYAHDILTLIKPYTFTRMHLALSAGTRFVRNMQADTDTAYGIFIFNPRTLHVQQELIPKDSACITTACSFAELRKKFITVLRLWTHQQDGFIPYVFGGTSFVSTEKNEFSFHKEGNKSWYTYHPSAHSIKTGFDCSGLVLRAAQIAGIPYFYKNTYTLANYLKPFQRGDQLENGDLIWIPGHVIIISDISHNLIIEARAYNHGFGRVHEIPLAAQFKNINSYQDLLKAYQLGKPLERINSKGEVVELIKEFKVLKLNSLV